MVENLSLEALSKLSPYNFTLALCSKNNLQKSNKARRIIRLNMEMKIIKTGTVSDGIFFRASNKRLKVENGFSCFNFQHCSELR